MTDVKCRVSKNEIVLDIKGHSGFDNTGRDIVCASVSMLSYAVAMYVDRQRGLSKSTSLKSGNVHIYIRCTDKERMERIKEVFRVFTDAFRLIAKTYPDFVTYRKA